MNREGVERDRARMKEIIKFCHGQVDPAAKQKTHLTKTTHRKKQAKQSETPLKKKKNRIGK